MLPSTHYKKGGLIPDLAGDSSISRGKVRLLGCFGVGRLPRTLFLIKDCYNPVLEEDIILSDALGTRRYLSSHH